MTKLTKKKSKTTSHSKKTKKKLQPKRKDSYGSSERAERPLGHLRRSLLKHNRNDTLSIM